MRRCTKKEKADGEISARGLSQKAWTLYVETEPLDIYSYKNDEGNWRNAILGALGDIDDLTFWELEKYLESMYDELYGEEE